jgi:ABC-type multidrug transport system fused ATPase/permease subunit
MKFRHPIHGSSAPGMFRFFENFIVIVSKKLLLIFAFFKTRTIMIQRIQTVYLFLAALCSVALFFFPVASFLSDLTYQKFFITGLVNMAPGGSTAIASSLVWPLSGVGALMAIIALAGIFTYKKRGLQLRLVMIGILLTVIMIAGIFFLYVPVIEKKLSVTPDYSGGIGIYFPLIALVLFILANRAIRRDDKLVKSLGRLR